MVSSGFRSVFSCVTSGFHLVLCVVPSGFHTALSPLTSGCEVFDPLLRWLFYGRLV